MEDHVRIAKCHNSSALLELGKQTSKRETRGTSDSVNSGTKGLGEAKSVPPMHTYRIFVSCSCLSLEAQPTSSTTTARSMLWTRGTSSSDIITRIVCDEAQLLPYDPAVWTKVCALRLNLLDMFVKASLRCSCRLSRPARCDLPIAGSTLIGAYCFSNDIRVLRKIVDNVHYWSNSFSRAEAQNLQLFGSCPIRK